MPTNLKQRDHQAFRYETLEGRRMLAGNVTVVENVHLFIRGDSADNQFEIVADGDQLRINGLEGTTINRQESYVVEGATSTGSGVSFEGGLRAHLGPGNDDIAVHDALFESMSIVYGGTGDDSVDVFDSEFMDQLFIQTYHGDDLVSATRSHFEGAFRILTLDGQDSVSMTDSMFAANSIVVTGNHSDTIDSAGNHYLGDTNFVLTLGGDDTVQLSNPVVGVQQLGIFLGNGDDTVYGDLTEAEVDGSVRIAGQEGTDQALQMSMSDEVSSHVSMAVEHSLLYDNGVGGISGVQGAYDLSFFNSQTDNFHYANDVQLSETESFGRISWTGTYSATKDGGQSFVQDDFTIEIYEGSSYSPTGDPIATFYVGDDVNRTYTGVEIPVLPSFDNETYPIYEYSADIEVTLEAGKIYWVSIFSATEEEVPAGAFGYDYNNFLWASGVGEAGHENSSAYTFGQEVAPNPGWFNDWGPGPSSLDFQLWS
ncbi:MAG: hypothetical protein AAFN77_21245 [Planctomycetota bacterium]